MLRRSTVAQKNDISPAISLQQAAAIADPTRSLGELVGNFSDVEALFEQLNQPAIIELGKPLPKKKFLSRKRVGNCHSAHNRALLGHRSRGSA